MISWAEVRNGESEKENASRGGELVEGGGEEGTQGSAVFEDAEERLDGGEVNGKAARAKDEKKKSKKRKRRGKKSRELQESKSQDAGEDVQEQNASQQPSQSRSFAEAMDDALDGHIGESEEYELLFDESPNARLAKAANGTSKKKRKRTRGDVEPAEASFEDGEGEELANMLNAARASLKTPKPGKSSKSQGTAADPEVSSDPLNPENEAAAGHIVADLSLLPKKIMKAKEKIKDSPRKSSVQSIIVDDDDSGAILHQPLTPAQASYLSEPNSQEDNMEAEAQLQRDARSIAPAEDVDENGTPVRPSKKALGKRKAVVAPIAEEPKKKRARRGKNPTPQGRDIRSYGSLISPAPLNEAFKPQFEIDPDESLPEFSQRVYLELDSEGSTHNTPDPPALPTKVSQSLKRVAKKPIMLPPNSFTPMNERRQPASDANTSLDPPPTSTGRRKRRLPTGEGESISIESKKTTSVKSETSARAKTPKTPKSDKKTPKARASAVPHGRVTKEEIDMISDAVETYKELHDLTQSEVNELIHQDAHSQRELWKHICAEVPDMPSRSVQNTCRRRFHNLDRGAFEPEDDELLRTLYKEYPDKWKQIGHEMNRFPEDVRDRWRNYLVCGNKIRKHVWDIGEEQNLKRLVREYIDNAREKFRYDDDPRLAQAGDDDLIDWSSISKMMNHTRSRLQCANKWRKMKAREESDSEDPAAEAPISDSWRLERAQDFVRDMNAADKLKLLTVLRDSGAGIENHIPWRGIVKDFKTPGDSLGCERMGLKLCFRLLKEKITDHDEMKFQEIVKFLIDAFQSAEPDEPADFKISEEELPPTKLKSSKQRRTTKISEQYVVDDEDDDNGEGPSTTTNPSRTGRSNGIFAEKPLNNGESSSTSRTKSSTNKKAEVSVEIVLARENGESSTTKKKKRDRRQKKQDTSEERPVKDQEEDAREVPSTTKTKRLRDRMRKQDQSQEDAAEDIEEPHGTLPSSDDLQQSLKALRTAKAKPKGRIIRQSKRVKVLSEEKVVDDENGDDHQLPVNGDAPNADRDRMDSKAERFSRPEAIAAPDDEEEDRYSHSQHHNIERNDDSSSAEEDQMSSEADEEYPAAGRPKREGSYEDDEEERYSQSQHHNRASLDLDENTDHDIMRNGDFDDENSDDDSERSDHHVTFNGDFEESDLDDSDIEDNRSEHYITSNGFHNHENDNEDEDDDEEEDGYEGMDSTYHDRASPDLDTPLPTQDFKRSTSDKLGSPFLMHTQPAWGEYGRRESSQSISSDDEMEDIPAILPPKEQRMESVDLDA